MGEDNSTPADTGPENSGETKDVFELEFADSREDVRAPAEPGAPAESAPPPPPGDDEPVEDLFAEDFAELGRMASDVIDATGQSYAGATPEDAARADSGRAAAMPGLASTPAAPPGRAPSTGPSDEVFANSADASDIIDAPRGGGGGVMASGQADDPLIGRTLGGYKIIEALAAGGMGAVYKAHHIRLQKKVALKVLLPKMQHVDEYVERFHREALLAAKLEHPNIVRVYDYGREEKDNIFYFVMQFVEGESLADRMKRVGRFPIRDAIRMTMEIARGLEIAHDTGLVHRDIKPDNILISKREEILITDFGLVKQGDEIEKESSVTTSAVNEGEELDLGLTVFGDIVGTPYYMAPEQCQGLPEIGPPADLYSLGLIFYGMLTGVVPIDGNSAMEIMQNRILKDPTPPIEIVPSIGAPISELIMQLLERDPETRLNSASNLLEKLGAIEKRAEFIRTARTDPNATVALGVPAPPVGRRPSSRRMRPPTGRLGPPPAGSGTRRPSPPPAAARPPRPPAGRPRTSRFGPAGQSGSHGRPASSAHLRPTSSSEVRRGNAAPEPAPMELDYGTSDAPVPPVDEIVSGKASGSSGSASRTEEYWEESAVPNSTSGLAPTVTAYGMSKPFGGGAVPSAVAHATSGERLNSRPVSDRPLSSDPSDYDSGEYTTAAQSGEFSASVGSGSDSDRITVASPAPARPPSSDLIKTLLPVVGGLVGLLLLALVGVVVWKQVTKPPKLALLELKGAGAKFTRTDFLEVTGRANRGPVIVTVNGESQPSDEDGTFKRKVKLVEGDNTIKVEVKAEDSPPETRELSIHLDTVAPEIAVDNDEGENRVQLPEDGILGGTLRDKNPLELKVDGRQVSVQKNGRFVCAVGQVEDTREVVVTARDRAGNEVERRLVVFMKAKLFIRRMDPIPAFTNTGKITVKGQTTRGPVSVDVGGRTGASDKEGNFEVDLPLAEGSNEFTLTVKDDKGENDSKSFKVTYDTAKPNIILEGEGSPGEVYLGNDRLLRGRVVERHLARFQLGATVVEVDDQGRFAIKIEIDEGTRTVNLSASDRASNKTERKILIYGPKFLAFKLSNEPAAETRTRELTLTGGANRGPVEVTAAGATTKSDKGGKFSLDVTLSEGQNDFEVVVKSEDGVVLKKSLSVFCDTAPPEVTVKGEQMNGWVPLGPAKILSGAVRDISLVSFKVMGKDVKVGEDGTFQTKLTLAEDPLAIKLEAIDRVGRKTIREITVGSESKFKKQAVTTILLDRVLWARASRDLQDKAIQLAGRRLGPAYKFSRTENYNCGGQAFRIAIFTHVQTGIEMNLIPGGQYLMGGADSDKSEQPVHQVTIRPFLISRHEVSQRAWDTLGLKGKDKRNFKGQALPIEGVSWSDLKLWLLKSKGRLRLPSESEWEYACRAGTTTKFYWGDAWDPSYAWYYDNSMQNYSKKRKTHPNSEHDLKANAFGLVDMLGNVKEWCEDDYLGDYKTGPNTNDSRGRGNGEYRVVRGGGWKDEFSQCRSYARRRHAPNFKYMDLGFRVARSLRWDGTVRYSTPSNPTGPKPGKGSPGRLTPAVVLADISLWNRADPKTQDGAVELALEKLGKDFKLDETRVYQCGGARHRIATLIHIPTEMKFQLIPGGKGTMGSSDGNDDEKPVHEVLLKPFLIARHELLQREWESLGGKNRSEWKGAARPADSVSWSELTKILTASGAPLRLPSESEWEYACRAGTKTKYFWGDEWDDSFVWFRDNADKNYSKIKRPSVNSKHDAKANAFGLVDMLGNVKEWCQDDYFGDYRKGPTTNAPMGQGNGEYRVVRGGSWFQDRSYCRSTDRFKHLPDHIWKDTGARLAVTVPE